MQRATDGGDMAYIGGIFTSAPVWLRLQWVGGFSGATTNVTASVAEDAAGPWSSVAHSVTFTFPSTPYLVGAAVTSHDTGALTTASLDRLILLRGVGDPSAVEDIGNTGIESNAAFDAQGFTIQAAGADVWTTADSFTFIPITDSTSTNGRVFKARVDSLVDTSPFAKAGVMFRANSSPGSMQVIVDAKPSGEIEFMARTCTDCDVNYLGGANITFPGYVAITQSGDTFTASYGQSATSLTSIGSITMPMSPASVGLAVTSHDTSILTTAVFGSVQ
jgi:hypothetical protein